MNLINNIIDMKKSFISFLLVACSLTMLAQTTQTYNQQTIVNKAVEEEQVVNSNHQVISNLLKDNWFVLGDAGINAYWADATSKGSFASRLTPQFNIGAGKWFIPGFGAKLQVTGFRSRADKWSEGYYTHASKEYIDKDGNSYWKERVKWFNVNVDLMFNISRIIAGYEGLESPKLMNQFIASIGLGATHPYDFPGYPNNDFAGHIELQYSRFFSKKKDFSLDVRFRTILQTTEFDGVFDDYFDKNISLNVGFTYYFKERGWKRTVSNTTYYVEDRATINQLNEEINRLRNTPTPVDTVIIKQGVDNLITFPYLVNFVIDKVKVVNRERVNLRVVAEMMKATPNQKYLICGYADKYTGSVKRNIWLAEHRAKNVYKILTEEFGVPASQLVLDDKGGVDNMYYDDPQLSRSAIITKYDEPQAK